MSNYLPTQYQQVFYVYFHVDPDSGEIVYVGSGTKERAWTARASNRHNEAHLTWLQRMETRGFTPDQYVSVVYRNSDKRAVLDKERELIEELKPEFNQTLNKWWWCLTLSEEQLKEARELRDEGMSYKKIGEVIGTSTMTVWRALNGETKGYV